MTKSARVIAAAAIALACLSIDAQSQDAAPNGASNAVRDNDSKQTQILFAGVKLVKEKHPAEAIQDYFDIVIASYEATYPPGGKAVYCARSSTESLLYLMQAAKDKKEAVVIGPAWCDAYYLKAYALVDLGRSAEARATLEKAIAMSPKNAHYVVELATFYRNEKDWKEALARYDTAAQIAREFAPAESKTMELGEALRGKGYVLVEMGRLDEAEAIYKECLTINPNDMTAAGELGYVQAKRKKGKS